MPLVALPAIAPAFAAAAAPAAAGIGTGLGSALLGGAVLGSGLLGTMPPGSAPGAPGGMAAPGIGPAQFGASELLRLGLSQIADLVASQSPRFPATNPLLGGFDFGGNLYGGAYPG